MVTLIRSSIFREKPRSVTTKEQKQVTHLIHCICGMLYIFQILSTSSILFNCDDFLLGIRQGDPRDRTLCYFSSRLPCLSPQAPALQPSAAIRGLSHLYAIVHPAFLSLFLEFSFQLCAPGKSLPSFRIQGEGFPLHQSFPTSPNLLYHPSQIPSCDALRWSSP